VRVLVEVQHFDIIQLDVQVLIDRLEDSTDADVILKLDGNRLVGKGLEETVKDTLSVLIGVDRRRNGVRRYLKKSMMAG
jgi:hypothetical protein